MPTTAAVIQLVESLLPKLITRYLTTTRKRLKHPIFTVLNGLSHALLRDDESTYVVLIRPEM